MNTLEKFALVSAERERFGAYLSVVPVQFHTTYALLFADHERSLLTGELSPDGFGSIVGELCRDLKGTADSFRAADRSRSGHWVRDMIRYRERTA